MYLLTQEDHETAQKLYEHTVSNKHGKSTLRLRTLLRKFGKEKRSTERTAQITQLLKEVGLIIDRPITKVNEEWVVGLDDNICLEAVQSDKTSEDTKCYKDSDVSDISDILHDLSSKDLANEREVEYKLLVPLLQLLGFSEDDRADHRPVSALSGAKITQHTIDFKLYEKSLSNSQPILIAEARYQERVVPSNTEITSAYRKAKDTCLWTSCHYCLITDSTKIEVWKINSGPMETDKRLFSCERYELTHKFDELYKLISKQRLIQYYVSSVNTQEQSIQLPTTDYAELELITKS